LDAWGGHRNNAAVLAADSHFTASLAARRAGRAGQKRQLIDGIGSDGPVDGVVDDWDEGHPDLFILIAVNYQPFPFLLDAIREIAAQRLLEPLPGLISYQAGTSPDGSMVHVSVSEIPRRWSVTLQARKTSRQHTADLL
jgi:hypothetical protein